MPTTEKRLTEEVRGAEDIVRVLEEAGIDMVFGIGAMGYAVPAAMAGKLVFRDVTSPLAAG